MKQFIEDGEVISVNRFGWQRVLIKAKSIQSVDMADAIGKLFKAYKRVMYRNTGSTRRT